MTEPKLERSTSLTHVIGEGGLARFVKLPTPHERAAIVTLVLGAQTEIDQAEALEKGAKAREACRKVLSEMEANGGDFFDEINSGGDAEVLSLAFSAVNLGSASQTGAVERMLDRISTAARLNRDLYEKIWEVCREGTGDFKHVPEG
ncbi:MAG: hypothetical protein AAGF76_03000 [Pseudomonadota bacterium]